MKLLKDLLQNNTITALIASKLDVSYGKNNCGIQFCSEKEFWLRYYIILGIHKLPIKWEKAPQYLRELYLDRYYEYRNYSEDTVFHQQLNLTESANPFRTNNLNIHSAINFILEVRPDNCKKYGKTFLMILFKILSTISNNFKIVYF